MLDDVHDQILAWLDREPAISAAAILKCLKATSRTGLPTTTCGRYSAQ
jgi:hypothetical protein